MAIPTTRVEFKEFCLRTLGAPVIQINVDDMQVEDRIDQAFYKYQQFHMDAVVKTYLKHEITASKMHFTTATANGFFLNEIINGQTSNAVGMVVPPGMWATDANTIYFFTTSGPATFVGSNAPTNGIAFVDGEVVKGISSGFTATIGTSNSSFTAIELGDMDNKYFPVTPSVIAVNKIFAPFDSRISADILFDPQAQFNMSLLSNFTSTSIIPYVVGRQYQQLLNDTFRGRPAIRFQRHQQRLYVDVNWYSTFQPHQYIVVDCYRVIDPLDSPSIWSDRWLQDYATALVKRQWAQNMSKYQGVQLPGGVTLDAKSMMAEAIEDIKALELDLTTMYQLPIDFVIG
jgi:hypothetical protein